MDEYENVKGIAVTTDYSGYMLFCFKNGKMAKISLSSYETKQNRKKLTNAYAGSSPLVKMFQLTQDLELAAISSIDKVLVFNTSSISVKATRDSQGVNVLTLKKSAVLKDVIKASEAGFKDINYYKTKNIPAVGCFLRDEDSRIQQTKLFEA